MRRKRGSSPPEHFKPTGMQLKRVFDDKYPNLEKVGWGPKLRKRFGYFTPDDQYEAIVEGIVTDRITWADIGCGRGMFGSNRRLARRLTQRAGYVLGMDPDPTIHENALLSEGVQCLVEEYTPDRLFDLITLRMVAEHIENPDRTVRSISTMLKKGGLVVLYTPHKWALLSILARITPMSAHHFFKKILWKTEERDTFPVQFKMNTRRVLVEVFARYGVEEMCYMVVDDCRVFQRYYVLNYIELSARRFFKFLRLQYPETCILAVYGKS